MIDEFLTMKEVATLLKIGEKTVYSLAQRGEIPAFKVGRQWRFRKSALEQWVKEQEQRPRSSRRATSHSPRRRRLVQVA